MITSVSSKRKRWHRRNRVAGLGTVEEEALKQGMEEKWKEFVKIGAEVYAKM